MASDTARPAAAAMSLMTKPEALTGALAGEIERPGATVGIDPAMIRLSVGLENVEDLIADLRQALPA